MVKKAIIVLKVQVPTHIISSMQIFFTVTFPA
jgi:hypothetical protein